MRRSFAYVALALPLLGCAARFDPASKIQSLRVLAVQKDKPYARPGDTVHLRMLLDDGGEPLNSGKRRRIQVAWIGGCEDPDNDAFANCLKQWPAGSAGGGIPVGKRGCYDAAHPMQPKVIDYLPILESGLDFSLPISSDIISCRKPSRGQEPYGSAFVFFAACAGELKLDPSGAGSLPLTCLGPKGEQLGAKDFVIGYTEVFAYDSFTNANPNLTHFQIDGCDVPVDCVGPECIALERRELQLEPASFLLSAPDAGAEAPVRRFDASVGNDGSFSDARPSPSRSADAGVAGGGPAFDAGAPRACPDMTDHSRFDACTTGDQDTCPKHSIKLVFPDDSGSKLTTVDHDQAQEWIENGGPCSRPVGCRTVLEQMWVNYYSDAGKIEHGVKLLNDATAGYNPNHSADLRAPLDVGSFHVWAVAHDNRGGTQWARVTLSTQNGFQ